MILILSPVLELHPMGTICSQMLFVILIALWHKSGTFWFSSFLTCIALETSLCCYASQDGPWPLISGYVYKWVSGSIWRFISVFGLLVKILRSGVFDLKLQVRPILSENPFFTTFSLLVTNLWLKLDFKPISQQPFLIWSHIFKKQVFLHLYWIAVNLRVKVLPEWLEWSFLETLGPVSVWKKSAGPLK